MNTKREALLLVHLSSLDSYTDEKGQAQGEWLGMELAQAIRTYPGPIFVTDQGWEYIGKHCQPRRFVEAALREHSCSVKFYHDETLHEWDAAMQELGELLRSYGISHLVIGGTWASSDNSEGCVNETRNLLEQQGFSCSIDETICGMIED